MKINDEWEIAAQLLTEALSKVACMLRRSFVVERHFIVPDDEKKGLLLISFNYEPTRSFVGISVWLGDEYYALSETPLFMRHIVAHELKKFLGDVEKAYERSLQAASQVAHLAEIVSKAPFDAARLISRKYNLPCEGEGKGEDDKIPEGTELGI